MIEPPLLRDAVGTLRHHHVVHGLLEGAVKAPVALLVHHVASLCEEPLLVLPLAVAASHADLLTEAGVEGLHLSTHLLASQLSLLGQ